LKFLDSRSPIIAFGDKLHGNDRKRRFLAFYRENTPEPHCDPHVGQPTVAASGPGNTGTLRFHVRGRQDLRVMNVYEAVKVDAFVKSRKASICHFDRREKSNLFKALMFQDFSLRSK
jgi:hypothetical protein